MCWEGDVGLPGQDKTEEIRIQAKDDRGWSMRKGQRPSHWVKCIRNGECLKGGDSRGEWQTKVGLVNPDMERHTTKGIPDAARIHPRMNRERLPHPTKATDVSALGMAVALPK